MTLPSSARRSMTLSLYMSIAFPLFSLWSMMRIPVEDNELRESNVRRLASSRSYLTRLPTVVCIPVLLSIAPDVAILYKKFPKTLTCTGWLYEGYNAHFPCWPCARREVIHIVAVSNLRFKEIISQYKFDSLKHPRMEHNFHNESSVHNVHNVHNVHTYA